MAERDTDQQLYSLLSDLKTIQENQSTRNRNLAAQLGMKLDKVVSTNYLNNQAELGEVVAAQYQCLSMSTLPQLEEYGFHVKTFLNNLWTKLPGFHNHIFLLGKNDKPTRKTADEIAHFEKGVDPTSEKRYEMSGKEFAEAMTQTVETLGYSDYFSDEAKRLQIHNQYKNYEPGESNSAIEIMIAVYKSLRDQGFSGNDIIA